MDDLFKTITSFDWDKGNAHKSWLKHRISQKQSEQAFFDPNIVTVSDKKHSQSETRHLLLGQTKERKLLSIVFTIRSTKVRIISARSMNKKERKAYESKKLTAYS